MDKDKLIEPLKTNRIEGLSDGIFAIAMTILILTFETVFQQPSIHANESSFIKALSGLWPDLLHYVQSFIILGTFWYQHHRQFHYIKSVDAPLLFINIIGLMFIGLIPFTTVIVSDYGDFRVAALVFELNLLLAGVIFFLHWVFATHKHYLIDKDLDISIIRYYRKRNLIIPVISLAALLVSIAAPRAGTLLFFLVPVILLVWKRPK